MAIVKLVIEDINLDTGEVAITTEVNGSKVDDGQMTAAEVMLRCLIAEIQDPSFRRKMWKMVESMVEGTEARVINPNFSPENTE